MEILERYLMRVTLGLAIAIYTIVSVGAFLVTPPSRAHLIAAVKRTPVAVGLRLERRHGAVTLAVLVQFRQEQRGHALREDFFERDLEIGRGPLYPLFLRLASPQRVD